MAFSNDPKQVRHRLKPGVLTLEGFLGDDARDLDEILQADDTTLQRLGITREALSDRLRLLTQKALEAFGSPTRSGDLEVHASESLGGWVECPFCADRFRKGEIRLQNMKTSQSIAWTPLLTHLIGEHGFFEGFGAAYRLNPEDIARVLGIESKNDH